MKLRLIADWLVYVAVRLVFCIVQALRIETCHRCARGLAWLFADVLRVRRKLVDENISRAFPELDERERRSLARGMWEHLLLMGCETAHLRRKVHDTNWRDYIKLKDTVHQSRAILSLRPCVLLSGHFGNFEAAAFLFGLYGFRCYTVARPLDNVFLDRWINSIRRGYGQYMMPKQDVAKKIALLLERGENLALLGDQYGGRNGCWIDFFGRPASYHKAIALFSMTGRAPIVLSYTRRLNGVPLQLQLGVEGVYDPLDPQQNLGGVKEITQWYNDLLERIIRRDPDQFWWLHDRWKGKPPEGKKRRKKLAA